jgi:hypothetical protein
LTQVGREDDQESKFGVEGHPPRATQPTRHGNFWLCHSLVPPKWSCQLLVVPFLPWHKMVDMPRRAHPARHGMTTKNGCAKKLACHVRVVGQD